MIRQLGLPAQAAIGLVLHFLEFGQERAQWRDQERLEAVAGHEGQRALEKVEPAERRKLEHQQHAMMPALGVQVLR